MKKKGIIQIIQIVSKRGWNIQKKNYLWSIIQWRQKIYPVVTWDIGLSNIAVLNWGQQQVLRLITWLTLRWTGQRPFRFLTEYFLPFFLNNKIDQQKNEKVKIEGESTIKQSTNGFPTVPSVVQIDNQSINHWICYCSKCDVNRQSINQPLDLLLSQVRYARY